MKLTPSTILLHYLQVLFLFFFPHRNHSLASTQLRYTYPSQIQVIGMFFVSMLKLLGLLKITDDVF